MIQKIVLFPSSVYKFDNKIVLLPYNTIVTPQAILNVMYHCAKEENSVCDFEYKTDGLFHVLYSSLNIFCSINSKKEADFIIIRKNEND